MALTKRVPSRNPAAAKPKAMAWPSAGAADLTLSAPHSRPATAGAPASESLTRAGGLPILLAAVPPGPAAAGHPAGAQGAAPSAAGTSVHVRVADQAGARAAGVAGVLFAVTRSAPPSSTGASVSVGVDYSAFRDAIGANWGNRLHLVQLPACALTTPSARACQVQTPIASSVNDVTASVVSASVPLDSSATPRPAATRGPDGGRTVQAATASGFVVAAVAGPAGTNGSFAASSLGPSGTWSVSGASGDFGWQYPLAVPPSSAGGVAPSVALSYDSQSVDGETAGTNNQTSWIGEGWGYSPGFVERTYRSCADDTTLPTASQTQDMCWAGQIVTMSLGGGSIPLVVDDAAPHAWHTLSDNGDRVEMLTGSGSGALNGEYWKVTTTDGTQYFFGRGSGPGHTNQGTTNSTWTEPVYGAHPGDPCNNAAGFAASSCQQAWRWNLDYVEDPHGNVAMYYYTPETNYYGADNGTAGVSYVRGGYLDHIDYGLRDENGSVYANAAPDQVLFTVTERCTPSGSVTCDPSQFSTANAANWPDTPADQLCTAGAVCNNHGPSFWSTKRLTTVTTQYRNGTGYTPVDTYALGQQFSTAGDPALWLTSITRTGHAADGTTVALPSISFTGQMYDNRVAGYNNEPPMARYRLTNITAETGQIIQVSYSATECTATNVPATPSQDTMRCFPVYWTLPYQTNQVLDYFHKYVTTKVAVQDPQALSPTNVTSYTYVGLPAWHFDDNELVKPANRTYGQFRGYAEVDVLGGDPNNNTNGLPDQQTLTKTSYFQGMNGDSLPGGGTRSATVTDSLGETVADDNLYADSAREMQVFNGNGGPRVSSAITDPMTVGQTASRARAGLPPLVATITATARTRKLTDLASGGVRTASTTFGYDTLGRQVSKTDSGDGVPDVCTTSTYADNLTTWVRDKVAESIVSQQVCPTGGTPAPILSDDRTYYDGQSTLGAVTIGEVTRGDIATTNANGNLTFMTTDTATFDGSGRPLTTTDSLGRKTSLAYTPADGGNLTKTVTTNALNQTSSITVDPGRNLATTTVDLAGHRTDATYDALGRLTAEWLPNHNKAAGAQPSVTFSYLLQQNGPQALTSKTLVDTGSGTGYVTAVKLYDALGQLRQTQADAEGGGRVVADTFYDSHGWASRTNNRYYTNGAPGTTMVSVTDDQVNDRTVAAHDGTGRTVLSTEYNGLTATWHNQTVYGGDRVTEFPPSGGVTTTVVTDTRGQTVEKRQYTAPPVVTGSVVSGGTYQSTAYHFTALGKQDSITDADGNVWSYTYDMLGRKTAANDPAAGASSYAYDTAGQLTSSTDGRGQTLAYTYDVLGRKTAEFSGSTSGTKLASWVYDTLQVGKLTYSTRYTPQGNYLVGVGSYDGAGNPGSYVVQLPTSETGLAGNFSTGYSYTTTNQVSVIRPADGGGLPSEGIAMGYDSLGNLTSSHGYNTYLGGASYTAFGEPSQYTLGTQSSTAWLSFNRDPQTRRLTDVNLSAQQAIPQLDDTQYSYDPMGNLTRSVDVQGPAGSATQTQCNSYDVLDRLAQTWTATDNCAAAPNTTQGTSNIGGTQPFWTSWAIDPTGLRTSQVRHALPGDTGGDTTTTYAYPAAGTPQADALASTSTSGPTGTSATTYTYDAGGNTTSRTLPGGQQTLTWDAENHLATDTTPTGTSSYVYDADGNQIVRHDTGSTTLYLPGEELTYSTSSKTVAGTRYYTVNGQTVAVRVGAADPVYLDGDQHGTMQTVFSPKAGTVTRRAFDPYGNQVGQAVTSGNGSSGPGAWPDQHGFLNAPTDSLTGLTDIGARKYDSTTGRFISVDSVLNAADPQSMTGYAYADNNPVTESDPSGLLVLPIPDWGIPDRPGTSDAQDRRMFVGVYIKAMRMAGQERQAAADRLSHMGISQDDVNRANDTKKKSIIDVVLQVGGDFLKGLLGIDDMKNCFGHGDVGSCMSLLLNVLPIGKILEKGVELIRFVVRAIDAVKEFFRAAQEADRVLNEVADVTRAVDASAHVDEAVARDVGAVDSGGGSLGCNSFAGATRVVLADGSSKPIDQVRVGDKVTNAAPGSPFVGPHVVTAVHVTYTDRAFDDVSVATPSGPATITTTARHLFWDVTTRAWTAAQDLRLGDQLDTPGEGRTTVVGSRHYTATITTYNLTIDTTHTYYVLAGDTPVLVHNCEGWSVPEEAKNKIPSEWGDGKANKKNAGQRWTDPRYQGNGVRIDPADPNGQPWQQVEHVIVRSGGKVLGRDGRPISGSIENDAENAHIPLHEWLKWDSWNSP